jgi:hypothetical protein
VRVTIVLRRFVLGLFAVWLLCGLVCLRVVGQGVQGGVEYNVLVVTVPVEIMGSIQTFIVPLNVSNTGLLSEYSLYVVSQGVPRYSYLFSRMPPVAVFLEVSAYSGVYEAWYGGGNPHATYTSMPGSQSSFWLAYDDFDYATGFWFNSSVSVLGSKATLEPDGYLALTMPYSPSTAHLWLLHGKRALALIFSEPYSEFVALTLTSLNFTDIELVQDGSDVFFVDPLGNCLHYGVLHLDKSAGILMVIVNPADNTAIFMLYGGANACPAHRVGL